MAWAEFSRGKRGKPDVQEFERNLADNLLALHADLSSLAYRHGPYHRFSISDPKPRIIHKASVRDRLVHHAINRVLYPYFDRLFIADSFSCRVGKGTHKALDRFRTLAGKVSRNHTRTCWVLKCDIRKFFASIDHELLLGILAERIPDINVLLLLREVVSSFSPGAPGVGLPLGNLTSQLFSNIYLNRLDQFVKHQLKAKHYIRYADDFVFLSEDRNQLLAWLPQVRDFLLGELRLALHPEKIYLQTFASGVDFLGWVHFPDHRVMRPASKRRMLSRLQEHPNEETIQSYLGLMRHGNTKNLEILARNLRWIHSSAVGQESMDDICPNEYK